MARTDRTIRPSSRDAIAAAAIQVLNDNAGASMSEIAIRAGVGRATLHRHFSSREELVSVLAVQCMDELETAINERLEPEMSAIDRLSVMFEVSIPLGDRFNFLSNQSGGDESSLQRYRAEIKWVENLVVELQAEGVIDPGVPTSWVVAQIDQLVWTGWKEISSGRLAPIDAPQLAVRTLLTGLQKEEA